MFQTSHSKTKLARRCLKAYKYKYIDRIRKKVKSKALVIGGLIHDCIDNYFKKGNYITVISAWKKKEFNKMFREEQVEYADIIPLSKALIRGWISNFEESEFEVVWTEKEGELEIADGIVLVYKIDALVQDQRERNWLMEHKTVNKMPGEEFRINDAQVLLYREVLRQIDDTKISGVIWDYIRKKLPSKPELLKNGGLSQAKRIDTIPSVYLAEIKRHGLDPKGYTEILEHLEAKLNTFYRRVKVPVKIGTGKTVMNELIATSNMLIMLENLHSEGTDMFCRNITKDCSWCDYQPLCHAELRGDDTDWLLKHDYERKKDEKKKAKRKAK